MLVMESKYRSPNGLVTPSLIYIVTLFLSNRNSPANFLV